MATIISITTKEAAKGCYKYINLSGLERPMRIYIRPGTVDSTKLRISNARFLDVNQQVSIIPIDVTIRVEKNWKKPVFCTLAILLGVFLLSSVLDLNPESYNAESEVTATPRVETVGDVVNLQEEADTPIVENKTNMASIPQELHAATSFGNDVTSMMPEEYIPYVIFDSDMTFEFYINTGEGIQCASGTYYVYLDENGMENIVCDNQNCSPICTFVFSKQVNQQWQVHLPYPEFGYTYDGDLFQEGSQTTSVTPYTDLEFDCDSYVGVWRSSETVGEDIPEYEVIIKSIENNIITFTLCEYRICSYENLSAILTPDGVAIINSYANDEKIMGYLFTQDNVSFQIFYNELISDDIVSLPIKTDYSVLA